MGTETIDTESFKLFERHVKLNNPLMGTETSLINCGEYKPAL